MSLITLISSDGFKDVTRSEANSSSFCFQFRGEICRKAVGTQSWRTAILPGFQSFKADSRASSSVFKFNPPGRAENPVGNHPRRLGLNIPGFGCVSGTKGFKNIPSFAQRVSHLSALTKQACVPACLGVRTLAVLCAHASLNWSVCAPGLKRPRGGALTLKTG